MMKSLSLDKAEFLRVLGARIVPESADFDLEGTTLFLTIIDEALQERPQNFRRQFGSYLGLLRWGPLLRYGKTFDRLKPIRQDAILRWFEDCPIGLLRKGFWGLKVLIYMGYYGQVDSWEKTGYAPEFDGRVGLRERA